MFSGCLLTVGGGALVRYSASWYSVRQSWGCGGGSCPMQVQAGNTFSGFFFAILFCNFCGGQKSFLDPRGGPQRWTTEVDSRGRLQMWTRRQGSWAVHLLRSHMRTFLFENKINKEDFRDSKHF